MEKNTLFNWVTIIVCLLAVLLCFYAYSDTSIAVNQCNINCQNQFTAKCMIGGQQFEPNVLYNISKPIDIKWN